jgi:hypothetical protein
MGAPLNPNLMQISDAAIIDTMTSLVLCFEISLVEKMMPGLGTIRNIEKWQ